MAAMPLNEIVFRLEGGLIMIRKLTNLQESVLARLEAAGGPFIAAATRRA